MRGILARLADRRAAAFQNDLMLKYYDEVQNIYRQMRSWRHDYHNHIQIMKAHIALGHTEELNAYLSELDADLTEVDTTIKTGNLMLDAILNSKLSLAAAKNISVNAKAAAPESVRLSDTELCVVIGNLLDNAIEACMKLENGSARFIRVYIGRFKGQFYISVSNSSGPDIRKIGGRYLTTKEGSYGFGLPRIDRIVGKHGGYINRQYEEGVFAVEIIFPM